MALSASKIESNEEISRGLLPNLRAAIAQFIANGLGSNSQVLPLRLLPSFQTKIQISLNKNLACLRAKLKFKID